MYKTPRRRVIRAWQRNGEGGNREVISSIQEGSHIVFGNSRRCLRHSVPSFPMANTAGHKVGGNSEFPLRGKAIEKFIKKNGKNDEESRKTFLVIF